jgi:hypothetical protein
MKRGAAQRRRAAGGREQRPAERERWPPTALVMTHEAVFPRVMVPIASRRDGRIAWRGGDLREGARIDVGVRGLLFECPVTC